MMTVSFQPQPQFSGLPKRPFRRAAEAIADSTSSATQVLFPNGRHRPTTDWRKPLRFLAQVFQKSNKVEPVLSAEAPVTAVIKSEPTTAVPPLTLSDGARERLQVLMRERDNALQASLTESPPTRLDAAQPSASGLNAATVDTIKKLAALQQEGGGVGPIVIRPPAMASVAAAPAQVAKRTVVSEYPTVERLVAHGFLDGDSAPHVERVLRLGDNAEVVNRITKTDLFKPGSPEAMRIQKGLNATIPDPRRPQKRIFVDA